MPPLPVVPPPSASTVSQLPWISVTGVESTYCQPQRPGLRHWWTQTIKYQPPRETSLKWCPSAPWGGWPGQCLSECVEGAVGQCVWSAFQLWSSELGEARTDAGLYISCVTDRNQRRRTDRSVPLRRPNTELPPLLLDQIPQRDWKATNESVNKINASVWVHVPRQLTSAFNLLLCVSQADSSRLGCALKTEGAFEPLGKLATP